MRTSAEWLWLVELMSPTSPVERIHAFAQNHGLVVGRRLGFGHHGSVFEAGDQEKKGLSALKGFEAASPYLRERDVYLRLQSHAVAEIRGCNVPRLLAHDDQLLVIQMSIVERPFVLDFAGAYLDKPPDFSQEVLADWHAEKVEQFAERWPEVQLILAVLEGLGIHMVDVHPGNISFPVDDES
jgi:hypothetical protein